LFISPISCFTLFHSLFVHLILSHVANFLSLICLT
jgi:hypothetical protein